MHPNQIVKYGRFKRELLSVIFDETFAFSTAETPGIRMWNYFKDFPKAALILKPLSSITDEQRSDCLTLDNSIHSYLISLGFAVPITIADEKGKPVTYSVEELIKENVIILEG